MSRAITLRPACAGDEAALVSLDEYATTSTARADEIAAAVRAGHCWCAVADDEIVGFRIDSGAFFHRPFLDIVMVKRSARRQGVAAALIAHFLQTHRAPAFSSCNVSNIAAQRMLSSSGFRICGYVEGLDEGDPELILRA